VLVTNNRVWTFATSSFVEGDMFRLVINIVLVFLATAPLEVKFELFDQHGNQFKRYREKVKRYFDDNWYKMEDSADKPEKFD